MDKPWAGRFEQATDKRVEQFTASVHYDKRLYSYDIAGSIAHARMLAHVGVLTEAECEAIVSGLVAIRLDIERGDFAWLTELEDVHMNVEARLTDRIGPVGKKLHTGRSRNDQVATDLRLYLRDQIDDLDAELTALMTALLDIAEDTAATLMPGFTHLQIAQPVTFGHHMMAWLEMLYRDHQRLADCRKRVNVMPLGSAALSGTSFPIDRAYTAELLGFDAVSENSMDAVGDRDFVIEFCGCSSLIMVHLSRMAEELILWSSPMFGFIKLGDAFCTGSSIMPQKKNPDVPELIRGKSGRVFGHLMGLLTLMKAQPLAYNRDNQEDKEPLFDTVDTLKACLQIYTAMLASMEINESRLLAVAGSGFSTATEFADYLVRKGVPFRDAHDIVGKAVRLAMTADCDLGDLSLSQMHDLHADIDDDVYAALSVEGAVAARAHTGGTAPKEVMAAIRRARQRLST